ncbi:Response regulator [Nitrincola lacisaponensis]|uniref:Response regulator n=1 Tax=Nitrincola lacisaponensis TaxID=267850 RepID=A0A063Y912_9GAMM|nr:HD domain-containing phosphohydrolase [Nitrincola lacisaponensis]KDE41226.1 Response regulator [Nitrincola lacisaponensis]
MLLMTTEPVSALSWKVLCVDDESSILRALKRLLPKATYDVTIATSGQEGLAVLAQQPIDLVISDMRMPGMSGAEFLEQVASLYPDTVRILLTGYSDIESTIAAVNRGRIHRYLQKPWDSDALLECLAQEMESRRLKRENEQLYHLVEAQNQELKELNSVLEKKVEQRTLQIRKALSDLQSSHQRVKEQVRAIIRVFYNLLSLKGTPGSAYTQEVSQLCWLLGGSLEQTDFERMNTKLAGLLGEVGVLCLDDYLVRKSWHEMNTLERDQFRTHAILAYRAMSPVQHLSSIALSVLHQFDRYDGKGNQQGLQGENLPLGSRILAVARDYIYAVRGVSADVRLSRAGALAKLREQAGLVYDPVLIEKLPDVLPSLNLDLLEQDERVVSTYNLVPGMKLSRDVVTSANLLLLPEGHQVSEHTIKRLQSYAESADEVLRIHIFSSRVRAVG